MRIVLVVDLAKKVSDKLLDDGLDLNYKKIKRKLPTHIDYLYCGGMHESSTNIANLLSLEKDMKVRIDKRLQEIEKYSTKLLKTKQKKESHIKNIILQKELISLCMFHLQEFILELKSEQKDNVVIVCNEFGCQLLITYALGISIDAVHSFSINPGSVILLDIHDMTSMNKIHL